MRACLLVILLMNAGCATLEYAESDESGRFVHLEDRHLSRFEHRLAIEEHQGRSDAGTAVGRAWLALINCEPIGDAPEDPDARWVVETLRLEAARRDVRVISYESSSVAFSRTVFADLYRRGAFAREPDTIAGNVEWPGELEQWADEIPAARRIETMCPGLKERLGAETTPEALLAQTHAALAVAPDARGGINASVFSVRGLAAQLAYREYLRIDREIRLGRDEDDPTLPARAERLRTRADAFLKPLDPAHVDGVEPEFAAHLLFLRARLRDLNDGDADMIVADLESARRIGLDARNVDRARYLELRTLVGLSRWSQAADLARELPSSDSATFPAFVYHALRATHATGQTERFLELAMRAFRDRSIEADPFSASAFRFVLERLVEFDFDTRTVELLEDMGPRTETYDRVDMYARIALDRGQPDNAASAAKYLLEHDQSDARRTSRYRGLLSLSAFWKDDRKEFNTHIRAMTRRDKNLLEAIPKHRRAAFFESADKELARLLRVMLPAMAEWGDSPAARTRRQVWLKRIVTETQRFLRSPDSSAVRDDLLELYRTASALLDAHPRGYAEHVGAETTPLVLGTVALSVNPPGAESEPSMEVRLIPPYALALFPRDGVSVSEWTLGWPREER